MKKLYARIVPLVFVLGACSSSDEPAADPSVPVGFSVQTETRAAVTGTTLPDGSLFKVWGGYDGNNVFDGREVKKTASGCTYTGTEYWVPGKTYNFHAVYPAEATLTVADDGTVSVSNFDCSATGDAAVDLMTASAPDDIRADEIIANQDPVKLTFSHLLSHISFAFDNKLTGGYAAEVTDISFSIQVKGDYNSSTEPSPWTTLNLGAITLYPAADLAAAPLKVANGSSVTSDPALVIPQSNTGVNVTFTVTIREIIDETTGSTTMTVVKRFTSPLATTDGEWEMGQRYEYKATLTDKLMEMDGLTQITLNVSITDWLVEDANVSWGGETAAP